MELIRENIYNSFIYQDRYKYYLTIQLLWHFLLV